MAVDNTFLSPYLQRPLELGADFVVHSATKFLNGHSDSIGGVLIASRPEDAEWFAFVQKSAGAILSPFDCFLVMRGIKTLAVRMDRHEQNARRSSSYLVGHPKVRRVLYPGLPDHPGHEIQKRQASGFGSMITIEMGSFAAAKAMLERDAGDELRREPGRRREPDLPPRLDDPRLDPGGAPGRAGPHRRHGAASRWGSRTWRTCWRTWSRRWAV